MESWAPKVYTDAEFEAAILREQEETGAGIDGQPLDDALDHHCDAHARRTYRKRVFDADFCVAAIAGGLENKHVEMMRTDPIAFARECELMIRAEALHDAIRAGESLRMEQAA